eukprot:15326867-Ditylum_brightwellii.AAC.1
MKQYSKYLAAAKALKNQLLRAFDDDYFLTMYDQATGYKEHTILELLQHLYTNYSQLDSIQLNANANELRGDYDPSTPIKIKIARVEKCIDIVTSGRAPFSLEQVLTYAFNAMYYTSLYNEKCLSWEDLPPVQRTWPTWKIYFTKVIRDYRRLHKAASMNYQANSTYGKTVQQDTIDALANLASAMADGRNAVANLAVANSTLASQTKSPNEHHTKQKEEMEAIKVNASDILTLLQDTNICHNTNNTNRYQNNRNNQNQTCQCVQPRVYYCWSHGVTSGEHHMSANCNDHKPGHKENATALTRMGRSTIGLE